MAIAKKLTGAGCSPQQAINIIGDNDYGVTATGTTGPTAYPIGACNTTFTTVALNTGAILPLLQANSDEYRVVNRGANALTLYPPTGGTINGAASASVSAGSYVFALCVSTDGLTWLSK